MNQQDLINNAIYAHKKGNYQEAIFLYNKIIESSPRMVDILFLLGVACRQIGEIDESVNWLQKASAYKPDDGRIIYELAVTFKIGNKPAEDVISLLNQALVKRYSASDCYFLLGEMYRKVNKIEIAIEFFMKAIKEKPDHFLAYFTLAMIYRETFYYDNAIECLNKAIVINTESAESYNNLGLLYQITKREDKALDCFRQAFTFKPDDITILANYVNTLTAFKMYDEAIQVMEGCLKRYPQSVEILNGLGNLYRQKENNAIAKEYYVRALKVKSDFSEAHFNLGLIMREWNRLDDAAVCFSNAITFSPALNSAHLNLGEILQVSGEIDKSEERFLTVLKFDPVNEKAVHNLLLSINYNETYSGKEVFDLHKNWYYKNGVDNKKWKNEKDPDKRLKVGYVSPDFCKHPASQFLESFLKYHSDTVDIYLYAQIQYRDSKTEYFRRQAAHWIEVQELSDEQFYDKVQNDRIDILVDCAGHMSGNRLGTFALHPAPVQVSAFGYPCTTGLNTIDYRISDSITDTVESIKNYTEKVITLDPCFCCYEPPKDSPEPLDLPAIKNGFITFGSLHTTARLNKEVITVWGHILNSVPGSRLLIFRTTLCESIIKRIRFWLNECSTDLSKVVFQNEIPQEGYLNIYNHIDCQLDTFPWSGHTTACESLWMGVPVITLYGDRHAGRMVSSVLNNCGMKEWIAYTKEEYIEKAQYAADNINLLNKLRKELRSILCTSELCNGKNYAKKLEDHYRTIWIDYCKQEESAVH